jgi:hypothetical protein
LISVSFLQFSFSVEFNCKVSIIHTHKARSCSKTLWVRHSYYILFQFKNLCSRNNRSFSYFLTKFVDFKCFFDDDSRLTLQQKTDEVLKSWKTGNSEFSVLFSFFPQKFFFLFDLDLFLFDSTELALRASWIFAWVDRTENIFVSAEARTDEKTKEHTNKRWNERTNEQKNKRTNDGVKEHTNKRTKKRRTDLRRFMCLGSRLICVKEWRNVEKISKSNYPRQYSIY